MQSLLSQQNRLPSVRACLEKRQVAADSDRDLRLGYAPALPGMPSYLLNCL